MIRYLVFGGELYNPQGGAHDIVAAFTRKKDAIEHARFIRETRVRSPGSYFTVTIDWVHVFDADHRKIIYDWEIGE